MKGDRNLCAMILRKIRSAFLILREEGWDGIRYRLCLIKDKERNRGQNCHREYDIYSIEEKGMQTTWQIKELEPIVFKTCEKPVVSILIPVYNQAAYTYYCLKSIQKYTEDIDYEIIIGDDCSTDATARLEEWVKGIRVIHHQKNCQFILNCNKISKEVKGKYIVFLNNDTQVQQGWLKALLSVMETNGNTGLVGSKLLYPNGLVQEAGGIVWRDANIQQYGKKWEAGEVGVNFIREADYISGASIMIRKELWDKIGGFDERFVPAYYEDVDLAFQVREKGYKVVYQPESEVVHFEGMTERMDEKRMERIEENRRKFLEKWGAVLDRRHYERADYALVVEQMRKGRNLNVI